MTRKCGLGFYPTNGLIMTGQYDQTARLERSGAYNATSGTTLGTRVVCHRLYAPKGANDQFDSVRNKTAWTPGTQEYLSMNSGHVVLWSCSGDGTTGTVAKNSGPFYLQISGGYWDFELQQIFAHIEALNWGGAVTPIPTTAGSKEIVPGSQYGGTKPTEMIWLQNHEPNINTGATRGTPYQFAGMMKHIAQLYDTWCTANSISTKHIKFAVCLSNPTGTTNVNTIAGNFYGIGADSSGHGDANDITNTSTGRKMDYAGWDIYSPRTENSGQGPVTAASGDEIAFAATSKYGACHAWTLANMPTNTMDIIPEYAIRMPTSPVSGGAGPDPTWPATWYSGMITYLNGNTLPNGNHPVAYMCQYAAGSVLSNRANGGGADNSIIPDQTTNKTSYQLGVDMSTNPPSGVGVSLRPAFTAFHDALITLGNPSLPSGGSPGVVPTGVSASTPAAGATSTTLSWTLNGANVSYDIYKDGTTSGFRTQSGLTSSPTTVYASSGSLPQTHTYAVGGVGTDGIQDAHVSSTVTVNYTASGVTPPVPTGLAASNVQQTTATASWNASTGATSYVVNLNSTDLAPVSGTSMGLTGLTPGASQTITVRAIGAGGATSAASSGVTFTTSLNPDTTPPSVPSGLSAVASSSQVSLTWTASTDTVVANAVTSGMGTYVVQRSLSPIAGTGTTLSPANLSTTSFLDTSPPASASGPTTVYYTVAAVDIATNPSAFSTPLSVVIPQTAPGVAPTAVLTLPTGGVTFGQLFTVDGSQSTPGSGGNITSYQFDLGDSQTIGPGSAAAASHAYAQTTVLSPQQFTVTLTVTDASNNTGKVTGTIVASPQTGSTFPVTNAAMLVKGVPPLADDVNTVFQAHENQFAGLGGRIALSENALAQIGDPLTPRRHNGALYASVNPEAAGSAFTVNAGTMYVIRCMTINGEPFSSVHWTQTSTTVTATVANSFWAVYDVTGALMSSTTATDCSTLWQTQQECSYTFDGGPFDPPLGADNTDANTSPPTNEFFVAFYLGAVGTNHPQIAIGSNFANAVNMGASTSAITPTQSNIQSVPLFSTAANTPSSNLTPPATLGALTRVGASMLVCLYA